MKTKYSIDAEDFDPGFTFFEIKKKYPKAFFFQANTLEGTPRLSIIGLNASETIRTSVGQDFLEIEIEGVVSQQSIDFLTYLSQRLNKLQRSENASAFPYEFGGAFGCIGYEIVQELEPRVKNYGDLKTLEDSGSSLAEVFLSNNLIIFEHEKNKIHFALQDFFLSALDLQKKSIANIKGRSMVGNYSFESLHATMGKEKFYEGVEKIKSHIRAGDIFQAVLSERFEFKVHASPLELFASVQSECPSAYSYYFDFKECSYFGASPETFVKIKNDLMETHPIAGTRSRGLNLAQDELQAEQLRKSVKENAEHLMLVDLARNDLGKVSVAGTVLVQNFKNILRLTNVMHLVSKVVGKKKIDKSNLDVFCACFPAGTLSGAPKVRAMEIISQQESTKRGLYGGAVVAFDHAGDLDSCIAIRSVEIKSEGHWQIAILRAGAGIVADSKASKEYEEVQHKLKAILRAIEIVETKHATQECVTA